MVGACEVSIADIIPPTTEAGGEPYDYDHHHSPIIFYRQIPSFSNSFPIPSINLASGLRISNLSQRKPFVASPFVINNRQQSQSQSRLRRKDISIGIISNPFSTLSKPTHHAIRRERDQHFRSLSPQLIVARPFRASRLSLGVLSSSCLKHL